MLEDDHKSQHFHLVIILKENQLYYMLLVWRLIEDLEVFVFYKKSTERTKHLRERT